MANIYKLDYTAEEINEKLGAVGDILEFLPEEMFETVTEVYDAGLEQGAIDGTTGEELENTSRVRTDFIPVGIGVVGTLPEGSTQQYGVRIYDKDKIYLGTAVAKEGGWTSGNSWSNSVPCLVDEIVNCVNTIPYTNAKYVRVFFNTGSVNAVEMVFTYTAVTDSLNGTKLDEVYDHSTKLPYREGDISLLYNIDEEGHYTKGFLKLPPNYKQTGKAVPLIVFVHGSGILNSLKIERMANDNYDRFYGYLRDCGYAVFDCFGWGNKYSANNNTFGSPTNNTCYLDGVKYVCEKYNIDINRVFVACKSLGGIQALAMCFQNQISIKACGMLAPEIDLFNTFGYNQKERQALAEDMGFTGDWLSIYGDNVTYDEATSKNYLKTQSHIMARYNGAWKNLILPLDTKVGNSAGEIDYDYSAVRLSSVPIKIWMAQDDENVPFEKIDFLIKTLINGGCSAELREMPEGTGGHHSTDWHENAPQTTDITTRCGIHYETIPTAFYELEKYFSSFAYEPQTV